MEVEKFMKIYIFMLILINCTLLNSINSTDQKLKIDSDEKKTVVSPSSSISPKRYVLPFTCKFHFFDTDSPAQANKVKK